MMEKKDLEMCERFKEVRFKIGLKQSDFAKELAISLGHASDIANGRKSVSDRLIEILNLKFNVSEKWIRTGEGEMFVQMSRDEEIAAFMGDVMAGETDNFKRRFIAMLARLNESQWELLEQMVDKIKKD